VCVCVCVCVCVVGMSTRLRSRFFARALTRQQTRRFGGGPAPAKAASSGNMSEAEKTAEKLANLPGGVRRPPLGG
jgi:hypothetical protein